MTVRLVDVPTPPRPPRDRLFEFVHGTVTWHCDLVAHPGGAVEAQFFEAGEFRYARNFVPALDETRTTRELAIAWAEEERRAVTGREGD